jgi:hypothetical protein
MLRKIKFKFKYRYCGVQLMHLLKLKSVTAK